MVATKIVVFTLGASLVVVGGYMVVTEAMKSKYTTLMDANEYGQDGDKDKFGGKFRRYMVSTTRDENKPFWESKIREISGLVEGSKLQTDGYLTDVQNKAEAWKNETGSKDTKLSEAIEELKSKCKSKYDESFNSAGYTEGDKGKWNEIWRYCTDGYANQMTFKSNN